MKVLLSLFFFLYAYSFFQVLLFFLYAACDGGGFGT
jgi:hypothetical protein